MTHHDLAHLGADVELLSADQLVVLDEAMQDIQRRYPDPDDPDDHRGGKLAAERRSAATAATLEYLLGHTTLESARRNLETTRAAARVAFVAAVQTAVLAHRLHGVEKKPAAAYAGVDRMQLLKALGER